MCQETEPQVYIPFVSFPLFVNIEVHLHRVKYFIHKELNKG